MPLPGPVKRADPEGLLYGAVVSAAVLAAASAHIEDYEYVALSVGFVLAVYWLAHVYVAAQTMQIDGSSHHVLHRLTHAARHEVGVLQGGVPAVAVYLAAALLGMENQNAATVAVLFSVGLLVAVGYLSAVRSGRTGAAALIDAAVAGLFGVIVVVGKTLLH